MRAIYIRALLIVAGAAALALIEMTAAARHADANGATSPLVWATRGDTMGRGGG